MADRLQIVPFPLRIPVEMKDWLKHKAIDNRRSLSKEIEYRLEQSRQQEVKEAA